MQGNKTMLGQGHTSAMANWGEKGKRRQKRGAQIETTEKGEN